LQVEGGVVAEEMRGRNPQVYAALAQLLPGIRLSHVPHERFKEMLHDVRAVVRTGEQSPYANVILHSGVTF
jgi:D-ribose pyranase